MYLHGDGGRDVSHLLRSFVAYDTPWSIAATPLDFSTVALGYWNISLALAYLYVRRTRGEVYLPGRFVVGPFGSHGFYPSRCRSREKSPPPITGGDDVKATLSNI